ncbi:unnamed protein product, partial [Ectocarpus sp. 12 AP-2014]
MKPRWEMGALLSVACFSSVQGYSTYSFPTSTSSSWGFTTTSSTSTSSGEHTTYSSYYSPSSSPDCIPSWISDGMCDSSNNNADCAYDGGDCCICDCVDTEDNCCGAYGFSCFDPTSDCFYHHYDDDYDSDYGEYGVDCSSTSEDFSEAGDKEPSTTESVTSDDGKRQFQWALSSAEQSGGWPLWLLPPSWRACLRLVASSAPTAATAPQSLLPLLPLLVTAQPKQ